jgi:t-SNARE complex subunit (syntaxin)
MNDARIKSLQQRRYSEVDNQQVERNQERIEHLSSILSALEEQVKNPTEKLEATKELLSVAGTETRTEGCNVVLSDCLKLLREVAKESGCREVYDERIEKMPAEAVSELQQQSGYHPDREPVEEKRRRVYLSECEEGGETDRNQGDLV